MVSLDALVGYSPELFSDGVIPPKEDDP
jgi:hypothetical protein